MPQIDFIVLIGLAAKNAVFAPFLFDDKSKASYGDALALPLPKHIYSEPNLY